MSASATLREVTAKQSSTAGWCEDAPGAPTEIPRARPTAPAARPGPRDGGGHQAAVGVILTASLLASLGSGTVTSTTPSRVDAVIFFASTPPGSAIERAKDP